MTRRLIHALAVRVVGPRLDYAWLVPELEQSFRTAIGDFWVVHRLCRADAPGFETPAEERAWMAQLVARMFTAI